MEKEHQKLNNKKSDGNFLFIKSSKLKAKFCSILLFTQKLEFPTKFVKKL